MLIRKEMCGRVAGEKGQYSDEFTTVSQFSGGEGINIRQRRYSDCYNPDGSHKEAAISLGNLVFSASKHLVQILTAKIDNVLYIGENYHLVDGKQYWEVTSKEIFMKFGNLYKKSVILVNGVMYFQDIHFSLTFEMTPEARFIFKFTSNLTWLIDENDYLHWCI